MKRVRQGQTQCTKRRITGGDRQDDDTDQGDHAAYRAQCILAKNTYYGSSGHSHQLPIFQNIVSTVYHGDTAGRCAHVDHGHSTCCPAHSDKALCHHHIEECHAAVLLRFDGTGDQCGLGAVETGKDTAGNGHEEDRQEMIAVCCKGTGAEVAAEVKAAVSCKHTYGVPVIPQVDQRISLGKDSHENAQCGEYQDQAEDGIDPSDDLIDREYGSDQVIHEDDRVNDPGRYFLGRAAKSKDLGGCDVAGGVNKYSAY